MDARKLIREVLQAISEDMRIIISEEVSNKNFEDIVDMKKLEQFALGLMNICMGEYGYTYINPEQMKIAIVLGDGNPFEKDSTLKWWMEEFIFKSYSDKDYISIEIDAEWIPGDKNQGWKKFNGKKFS